MSADPRPASTLQPVTYTEGSSPEPSRVIRSLHELVILLNGFTFWPGWEFSAYLDEHLGLMLFIVGTVPDRDDVTRAIDLGIRARVPPHALDSSAQFGRWLLWRLEEAYIHEVREGLRYRGALVSDPHRGERASGPA